MLTNLTHRTLSILAGSIWLLAGANLLFLGTRFLLQSAQPAVIATSNLPILNAIMGWVPQVEFAIPILAFIAAGIGVLKGSTILRKAARREVKRITLLPHPVSITQLYSRRGVILLAVMVCLGISLRFMNVPLDVRGVIDVAVGVGLILGSLSYLRLGQSANVEA